MTRTGSDISKNGDVKEAAKFFKWEMSLGKSAVNGINCVVWTLLNLATHLQTKRDNSE